LYQEEHRMGGETLRTKGKTGGPKQNLPSSGEWGGAPKRHPVVWMREWEGPLLQYDPGNRAPSACLKLYNEPNKKQKKGGVGVRRLQDYRVQQRRV